MHSRNRPPEAPGREHCSAGGFHFQAPTAVITASITALPPFINRDFEAPKVSETLLRPLARTARRRPDGAVPVSPLAHPERPLRTQPLVAKRRTHAAKRERPGREARAFTLNRSARQFRARLLK